MSGRSDILRPLEPVARPGESRQIARPLRRRPDLASAGFRTLIDGVLHEAQAAAVPVTIPREVDLTDSQRARLDRAAQEAAACGSTRALVMLDGRTLMLDVPSRYVNEELRPDASEDRIITDVDTIVISRVEQARESAPKHRLLLSRLDGAASCSIADLLALQPDASDAPDAPGSNETTGREPVPSRSRRQ